MGLHYIRDTWNLENIRNDCRIKAMHYFVKSLMWLDRVVNVMLGGSYNETLSSRAHRMRMKRQPYWGWTADAIDWLFFWELDHCAAQWRREVLMGWHD